MTYARLVALLAALMFGLFGAWLLVAPERLDTWLGISASTAQGRTELRAIYGGLELGLAAFLLAGSLRPALAPAACLGLALVMFGIAGARLVGFIVDDSVSSTLVWFLVTEVAFALLGFFGYLKTTARRDD